MTPRLRTRLERLYATITTWCWEQLGRIDVPHLSAEIASLGGTVVAGMSVKDRVDMFTDLTLVRTPVERS